MFHPGIPRDDLIWDQWQNCMISRVGMCQVWNVYTFDRRVDDIAIQLLETSDRYIIVNRTASYDQGSNRVICQEVGRMSRKVKRQFVHFEQVCNSFADWAKSKQCRNFSAEHYATFQESNLVRVECGSGGNCFYHSCEFGLKIYNTPVSVANDVTHSGLRTATVNHLRSQYKTIDTPEGPLHMLLPGASNIDEHELTQLVEDYCDKQGRLGEFVEDPCIRVFANLFGISIFVYLTSSPLPVKINDDESGSRRILTLWCDGGHYQVRCRPLPYI